MAISATGEGCHKEMSAILDDLVNGILVFLKDPVSLSWSIETRENSSFSRLIHSSIHVFVMLLAMLWVKCQLIFKEHFKRNFTAKLFLVFCRFSTTTKIREHKHTAELHSSISLKIVRHGCWSNICHWSSKNSSKSWVGNIKRFVEISSINWLNRKQIVSI